MELFLVIGLAGLAVLTAGLLLGVVAFLRTDRYRQALIEADARIRTLEAMLGHRGHEAPIHPAPAPMPAPQAELVPAAFAAPELREARPPSASEPPAQPRLPPVPAPAFRVDDSEPAAPPHSASCTTVAWGGMGLIQNDVRGSVWPTIPVVYNSSLAWEVLERGEGAPLAHPFDFRAAPPPDAVVIGLGTNDAAGDFGNATFAQLFVDEYVRFVGQIAATYAAARGGAGPAFFLANATCMASPYAPHVARAAAALGAAGRSVTVVDLSVGARCECGHPSAAQHAVMAEKALPVIRGVMGW